MHNENSSLMSNDDNVWVEKGKVKEGRKYRRLKPFCILRFLFLLYTNNSNCEDGEITQCSSPNILQEVRTSEKAK